MMRLNKRGMITSFALVIILLTILVSPSWAQSAATRFSRLIVNQTFTSIGTSTLTGAVTTGGDVTVGDDLTVTDDVAVSGDLASPILKLTVSSVVTVSNGGTLTPAASFQPIASAGTVGAALGVCPAGLVTVIENTVAQTITFTDTGTSKLAGNVALGQYDTITVIGDGTNCYEVTRANN